MNQGAMELRHLRYFAAVAEAVSFSRAALRLRITQPALSRQIHDLERQLGVRLFDRIGRRIQLSAAGDDLLARCRRLLADADSIGERAQSLGRGETGILQIGATPQTLQSLLADFLTRYRRRRPAVEVRLTEDGGMRLLTLVERGELHVALGAMPTDPGLTALRPLSVPRPGGDGTLTSAWPEEAGRAGRARAGAADAAPAGFRLAGHLRRGVSRPRRAAPGRVRERGAALARRPRRGRPRRRRGAVHRPARDVAGAGPPRFCFRGGGWRLRGRPPGGAG